MNDSISMTEDQPIPEFDDAAQGDMTPLASDFSFNDLPETLRSIVASIGWTDPTPVQSAAIPTLMSGRDLIVQAKTGSGKTAAYLLPMIQTVVPENEWSQALVLVPTRELARQVYEVLMQLIEGLPLRGALVYGGVGYGEQNAALRGGAHIVVGTPGRILDHIYRGTFSVQRITWLVLDEADELLSMGFLPALRKLRAQLPKDRQTCLCSATIPYHVEDLAHSFLHNPERLILSRGQEVVSTLEHMYYVVPALQKDRMLLRLIEMENPDSAIVFCNTKREVEYLSQVLKNNGCDARHLTGDVAQNARERTVQQLRDGTLRFIVATDVIARGIDISDLSHVFLYDIPENIAVYVHRSGRTARAGKTGIAITLCEDFEEGRLLAIARQYHFDIAKRELPNPEDVAARTGERLLVLLETEMTGLALQDRERLERYGPLVETLREDEDGKKLLAMLLDRAYTRGLQMPVFTPEPPPPVAQQGPSASGKGPKRRRGGGGGGGRR